MASGDVFERYSPPHLTSASGSDGAGEQVVVGTVKAVRLLKAGPTSDGSAYFAVGRVWTNGTPLSTGLTVEVVVVDDPNNPDPGGAVVIGATIVPLVSGSGVVTSPAYTNEATATVTTSSTEGNTTTATIALANSKLSSLAASGYFLLRLRRIATSSSDTHSGDVLLLDATVKDT